MTMLHFFPRHGRKHQIRIHCADGLGCSIVGDPRHRGTLVGQGLFLCAIGLDFTHPTTGEPLSLSLPYPPRFVSFPSSQHQVALPLCVCVCVCSFLCVCSFVCVRARARDKFGVLGRCTDPRSNPSFLALLVCFGRRMHECVFDLKFAVTDIGGRCGRRLTRTHL